MKRATKLNSFDVQAFNAKVSEVRANLIAGLIDDARKSLDDAWKVAGDYKPARTQCHDLGNKVQIAIFSKEYPEFASEVN